MNWDEECQKIDMEEELVKLRKAIEPIREIWKIIRDENPLWWPLNEKAKIKEAISRTMAIVEGKG
jgi:hypothetical protein